MTEKTYHDQKVIEYTKDLRSYLAELPPYVTTFFRGIEVKTQARSRLAYAVDLKVFFEWLKNNNPLFRNKSVSEITLEDLSALQTFDIEEYVEFIKLREGSDGKEISNSEVTIKRKMSALRGLFGYLYKNQMIDNNPVVMVDMPKVHEKAIIRLDGDEIGDLLNIVDEGSNNMSARQQKFHELNRQRDVALVTLLLGTGMRVSECVGINLNDVDLKNDRIKVIRKGGYEAFIYFGEEVKTALLPYYELRKTDCKASGDIDGPLFLSNQKKRVCVRSVEKLVKKYSELVTTTKKITPHKLRSTYGTALYKETGDIYLVADVLGHKDVNTTRKHYAALEEDRRRSAKDAVKLRHEDK